MDDNLLFRMFFGFAVGSLFVVSAILLLGIFVLDIGFSWDIGLAFTLFSFGPSAVLAFALAVSLVVRRLRYVPVAGIIGRVSENSRCRPVYWWRYEFGGRWYEERDEAAPSWQLDLAFSFAPNKRYGTVYVDPADPSRLLPPSWKARLAIFIEAVVLYVFAAAYALICF